MEILGKNRLKLTANFVPTQYLDTGDFAAHNIQDEHPLLGP